MENGEKTVEFGGGVYDVCVDVCVCVWGGG